MVPTKKNERNQSQTPNLKIKIFKKVLTANAWAIPKCGEFLPHKGLK
jgi:hypothetical protein